MRCPPRIALAIGVALVAAGCHRTGTPVTTSGNLSRTTCPNGGKNDGSCLEYLHQQPREFWEAYQREAPALIDGVYACEEIRNDFGDWLRVNRQELFLKDRQENMVNGYLPHAVAVEADMAVNQMGNAYTDEYRQILNSGARPELCRERAAYWKGQILMILSKFPPLR